MKSRRGFFSALAGAIGGSAVPAIASPERRGRLDLMTGLVCPCGQVMIGESVNARGETVGYQDEGSRETFRCPSPKCANYRKRFERPSLELREVGLVTDKMQKKIDADRIAFEESYYGRRLGE
jgi:hypothetical protein